MSRLTTLRACCAIIVAGALGMAGTAAATPPPPPRSEPPAPETPSQLSLGLELGPGGVITAYNRNTGPSALLFYGSLRAALPLDPHWAGELVLRQWWLPGNHATMLGVGARFEPVSYPFGRVFIDGVIGVASTDYAWSFGYDIGGGFEWNFIDVPGLYIGPYLRYGSVIDPDRSTNDDGRAWTLGASFTYRLGEASSAPAAAAARRSGGPFRISIPDTDGDGIADDEDECRTVKQGAHPDPYRTGCPEPDEDRDGIPDGDDPCPLAAPGHRPDPKRPGCPLIDSDGDGISDAEDACPSKAGVASPDATKNGCPAPRKRGQVEEPGGGAPPESNPAPKPVHKRHPQ